jgi:hypothetical protein
VTDILDYNDTIRVVKSFIAKAPRLAPAEKTAAKSKIEMNLGSNSLKILRTSYEHFFAGSALSEERQVYLFVAKTPRRT